MQSETSTAITSTPEVKQVICIKWGTVYNERDVNVFYGMVARNITGLFRVICFTDDPAGIRPEVECFPLPELGCEIPPDVPGKWPKVALWNKELFGLKGLVLFIDLDSVIVGNLDDYFTYGSPDDVITARNWVKPLQRLGQTSVFRFQIGKHSYMLENLRSNPVEISRKYRYEQHYVTNGIRGGIKFWPEKWTRHFRLHCLGNWLTRLVLAPRLPRNAKVITFAGGDKVGDAISGRCCGTPGFGSALRHIRWAFSAEAKKATGKGCLKNIKTYMRPASWLGGYWRE